MVLADSSALEARLGRLLTPAEETRVDALLQDASALVVAYTRQSFVEVADEEAVLRADYGAIRLPRRPVTDVASVAAVGVNGMPDIAVVGWAWDEIDTITLGPWGEAVINLPEAWMEAQSNLAPTYRVVWSHGYAVVPGDVTAVVCGMVLRCLTSPTMASGLVQEVIGPYSYRLDKGTSGSIVALSDDDRRALSVYRSPVAMLRL